MYVSSKLDQEEQSGLLEWKDIGDYGGAHTYSPEVEVILVYVPRLFRLVRADRVTRPIELHLSDLIALMHEAI